MNKIQFQKLAAVFAVSAVIGACGGSSDNVSPGSVVVEVPGAGGGNGGNNNGGNNNGGNNGGGNGNNGGGNNGATPMPSTIPAALNAAISNSGDTAPAGGVGGGLPIFDIDVSQLPNGVLDPTGLVLGNDSVFRITNGALRVTGGAATANARVDGVVPRANAVTGDVDGDCVLLVRPGAVIAAESGSEFIVIEQGCKIDAQGTANQPIVLTSMSDVNGEVEPGTRGQWGGLVINGRAPINDCPQGADGGTAECTKEGEANSGTFGGAIADDDSGALRYVSVRYAGSRVDNENELNGIAFQGVGSATEVEFVQVHNNLDDGIEFFGGTVNARNIVLTGNADDSLDWSDGWTGSIQFLYIEQAADSGDNAIEADSRNGNETAQPESNPSISNMTVVGNTGERALRLRRGTGLTLRNSFIDGSAECLRIDGDVSRGKLGGQLTIENTSFSCATTVTDDDDSAVANYLATAIEVSLDGGNVAPATTLPAPFSNDDANFIGAIGADNWTAGWTVPGSVTRAQQPDFGCPTGTTTSTRMLNNTRVCQITGTVTQNLVLTSNNLYELVGAVFIGEDNQNSATLTVQAGTTIFGGTASDFLVVSRGSQIEALGTRTSPITLTSQDDLEGTTTDNSRGLWGGLVINGNAPINDCPQGQAGGTEGCTKEGEANSGTFGGATADDNSGTLRYVVVKFAGSRVDNENELNGIAFQGVGSGTTVEFVQVHNNLDDGIEFFGGTVNAKYVVLTGNADDSLDWTDGWQGSIQYLLIDQADDAGDNGIEADSRSGNEDALPRSLPRIANMTIQGRDGERGIRLRRGTGLNLYNTVVNGSTNCLRIEGGSLNLLGDNDLTFGGISFDCSTVVEGDDVNAITAELDNNVSLTGASVAPMSLANDAFFDDSGFIGAVQDAANDWTTGWTVGMPNINADLDCPVGTTQVTQIGDRRTCQLSGTINTDITLVRNHYYVLDGAVFIGGDNANSAVLTIQSGTTILGDDASDFLVVSRGSQIVANGTAMNPVVMTAAAEVNGTGVAADARGLWGGLVINGNAPINDCPVDQTGGTTGCTKEGEANSGTFGGADAADNSGVLNYVVVKFAGSRVDNENELNGIAFQGVGSGTQVDFIQVHNNLDDGIEFFGGSVDAKHVILTGNGDDSLDWTDGWTGRVQYIHILQSANAGDNGIEADNRENDENATPRSNPMIANMSIVGNADERAIRLRRGTGANLYNVAVSGSNSCLRVEGASLGQLNTGITIESASLQCTSQVDSDDGTVQGFLDGSTNITTDGTNPPAATLPADGFFEQNSVIGSDVNNWSGTWAVGL